MHHKTSVGRGVKEILKPHAYKQWEPLHNGLLVLSRSDAKRRDSKELKDEIDSDGVHRGKGDFGSRGEAKGTPARWARRESIVQG